MPPRFLNKKQIAQKLGVSVEIFHHEIKKLIKKDFKSELLQFGVENPDILIDENDLIFLADPNNHTSYIDTNVNIFDYLE